MSSRARAGCLQTGRKAEGLAVLTKLLGPAGAKVEADAIHEASGEGEAPFSLLFSKTLRRPLVIACGLALFCQFSGINAIMYYAPEVFKSGGESSDAAFQATVWVGVVNLLFTFVAIACVDRLGRRPLLLAGSALQFIMLLIVGYMFLQGRTGGALLLPILGFIGAFAMAMGPIPWIMISEIFPGNIRGRASSIGVFMVWVSCYIVALHLPDVLKNGIGPGGAFFVYAGCSLLSFIFVFFLVPETKGRTLEEISAAWAK